MSFHEISAGKFVDGMSTPWGWDVDPLNQFVSVEKEFEPKNIDE